MRLHIEGQGMTIVPHLLGRIAERLEHLNEPYEDIFVARVALVNQGRQHEARVRLLLAGKTLYAVQHGDSPDAAIGAALRHVEVALNGDVPYDATRPAAMYSPRTSRPSARPCAPASMPSATSRRRLPVSSTVAKHTAW